MLHFQRNYPHSATASIPVSCPPHLSLSLSFPIECTQCAAILVACIPPFSRFFSPLFLAACSSFPLIFFFFFSLSSPPHKPVPVRREPTIRRLQPICKFYPLLRQVPWITKVLLEPTVALADWSSFQILLDSVLYDRLFLPLVRSCFFPFFFFEIDIQIFELLGSSWWMHR